MINDEVLRKAATEANQVITESLPSSAACAHSFSPTFHKKMQRTIRRGNHPLIARLPKQIACFIISAVIIGGTWLTVDAEARTAFLVWVRETYEEFVAYRFVGNTVAENSNAHYELTWLPEGYAEIDRLPTDDGCTIIYSNGVSLIQFVYASGTDASSLFVGDFSGEVQTIRVGTLYVDFYQPQDGGISSTAVWMSEQQDTLFSVTASLPKPLMIALCKGVQKIS